jgi:hypothetical protein
MQPRGGFSAQLHRRETETAARISDHKGFLKPLPPNLGGVMIKVGLGPRSSAIPGRQSAD